MYTVDYGLDLYGLRRFYLFYIFSLVKVSKHRKRHMLEKSIRSQPRIWPLHISLTYTANLRVASDRTMDEIDVYSIEIIELNHSADMRTEKIRPAHFETYILPQDGAKLPNITDVLPCISRVYTHIQTVTGLLVSESIDTAQQWDHVALESIHRADENPCARWAH